MCGAARPAPSGIPPDGTCFPSAEKPFFGFQPVRARTRAAGGQSGECRDGKTEHVDRSRTKRLSAQSSTTRRTRHYEMRPSQHLVDLAADLRQKARLARRQEGERSAQSAAYRAVYVRQGVLKGTDDRSQHRRMSMPKDTARPA